MKNQIYHKTSFPIILASVLFFSGNILQEIDTLISKDTNSLYYFLGLGALLTIAKCIAYIICLFDLIFYYFTGYLSPKARFVFIVAFILHLIGLCQLYFSDNLFLVMLLENAVRFMMPLIIYIVISQKSTNKRWLIVSKTAIALTFLFHGLLALNIFPIPSAFFMMVNNILGFDIPQSINFLRVFGLLDLIAVICIFTKRLESISLVYCTAWGIITAFARLSLTESWSFMHIVFHILPLTLNRLSNGLLPFYLFKLKKHRLTA